MVEVADAAGEERWTTIHWVEQAGETITETIERAIQETLGPDAHAELSKPRSIGTVTTPFHGDGSGIDDPCAVEISGRLQPQGVARRFSWFIVTALPAQAQLVVGIRPVLADFLEAQGEAGLAARLRRF